MTQKWIVEVFKHSHALSSKRRTFKTREDAFSYVSDIMDDYYDRPEYQTHVILPDGRIDTWNGSSAF